MAMYTHVVCCLAYAWIFLSTFPFTKAQTNCDEWVLSQGSQYCFQAIQGTKSKSECENLCTVRGATLPLVTSEPVNRALTKLIAERHLVEVWLGLVEFSSTWRWQDDQREVAGQGCYLDDEDDRDLQGPYDIEEGVTVESCRTACFNRGFRYCGLQGGTSCYCGNTYGRYGMTNDCIIPCQANYTQSCGGFMSNNIYSTTGVYSDWGADQPNNHLFYQACGVSDYSLDFRWNDAPCVEKYGAICEKSVPEDECDGLYFEDKCISASAERMDWFDWNYECRLNRGGKLLHLRDASEANAVKLHIQEYIDDNPDVGTGNKSSFWLNLVEKHWEWFTGERILYEHWAANKPNGWNLPCAIIKDSGFWFDVDCSLVKGCLCQIDNATHIVEAVTQPPLPPAPTTTIPTTTTIATTTVATTPFFSLQGYGQWIIVAGSILFFLILVAIIICQLRLWRKRKEKQAKDFNLYYGMDDPSSVDGRASTAEPVFIDPATLNPHAPDGKLNMLGSWEIPALTEKEEEARIKAKQQKAKTSNPSISSEEGETGVSYSTDPNKTEEEEKRDDVMLF